LRLSRHHVLTDVFSLVSPLPLCFFFHIFTIDFEVLFENTRLTAPCKERSTDKTKRKRLFEREKKNTRFLLARHSQRNSVVVSSPGVVGAGVVGMVVGMVVGTVVGVVSTKTLNAKVNAPLTPLLSVTPLSAALKNTAQDEGRSGKANAPLAGSAAQMPDACGMMTTVLGSGHGKPKTT
jgi:hypothetical protein